MVCSIQLANYEQWFLNIKHTKLAFEWQCMFSIEQFVVVVLVVGFFRQQTLRLVAENSQHCKQLFSMDEDFSSIQLRLSPTIMIANQHNDNNRNNRNYMQLVGIFILVLQNSGNFWPKIAYFIFNELALVVCVCVYLITFNNCFALFSYFWLCLCVSCPCNLGHLRAKNGCPKMFNMAKNPTKTTIDLNSQTLWSVFFFIAAGNVVECCYIIVVYVVCLVLLQVAMIIIQQFLISSLCLCEILRTNLFVFNIVCFVPGTNFVK